MILTAAEVTKNLTQAEYERLLNRLASAIQTQRRFITILSAEKINGVITRYTVKRNGTYYPYQVEEVFKPNGVNLYLNLGLVI